LADSCSGEDLRALKNEHPEAIVVSYINCNADVKAESDIIVTSSNAEQIIKSIPEEQEIIFAPDKNLGRYLNEKTGKNMILWDGVCIVHEAFSMERIAKQIYENPEAKVIAHPESSKEVLSLADYIGSTSNMINYVINNPAKEFIVATEEGVLHEMQKKAPDKKLIPALVQDENCSCSECFYMKLNTMEKLYLCMKYELPEVTLEENLRIRALGAINRMMDLSINIK
jgi:quinolinate synthase